MAKASIVSKQREQENEVTLRFDYQFFESKLGYDLRWQDSVFRQKWNMMTSWLSFNALKIKTMNLNGIDSETLVELIPALRFCSNTQELFLSGVNNLWSQTNIVELAKKLPKISKLDISNSNLQIRNIKDVLSFLNCLPDLKCLSLAGSEYFFDGDDYYSNSAILRKLACKFKTLDYLDLSNTSIPARYITSIFDAIPSQLELKGVTLRNDGMSNVVACLKLAKPGTVINLKDATVESASEWSLIKDLCQYNQLLTVNLCPETINRSAAIKQLAQQRSEPGIKSFIKVIFDDTNLVVFVGQFCTPEENNEILPVNKVLDDCAELSQVLSERTKRYGHYKNKLLGQPSEELQHSEDTSYDDTVTAEVAIDEVPVIDPSGHFADH